VTRRLLFGSLTRISDLESEDFDVVALDRGAWRSADYVVARVIDVGQQHRLEFSTGRLASFEEGDLLVGALGARHATLEATGDWREIGPDGEMQLLTGAGLFGRCTSVSTMLGSLARLQYVGHASRAGSTLRMQDFVDEVPHVEYRVPTVLIVGTSMSAGKTSAARVVVRVLCEAGLRVAGAKITGAGRYRDVLTMGDAGADPILDFVDAGLPSSICSVSRFQEAAGHILGRIQSSGVDAAVIEAGVAALGSNVSFSMLAASDPYAVLGVTAAFGLKPDVVTGVAANTRAGIELVESLTGLPSVNVRDPESAAELGRMLRAALGPMDD
jgi:hypothetical protein